MPVTINTANHASRPWTQGKVTSSNDLFKSACWKDSEEGKSLIQSSVLRKEFREKHISASTNGFVYAAFNAYSYHHHLVLRPEDIWFAILSQLNFYINAHAEELRDHFVSHEGQKELEVKDVGSIDQADFGKMAQRMADLIQENVKQPDLQEWIMPSFSTTTSCDRTVAAILMMGSMQKYFSYRMTMCCGIPSVTLLGTREDWENIWDRLDKLSSLGDEPRVFGTQLAPILRNFIASFDSPLDPSTLAFWGRIAHEHNMGSGPTYLSGWITAFTFWDEKGKCMYGDVRGPGPSRPGCELDGVKYHRIDISDVPAGYASVPVTVDDNGEIYHTKMLAGSFGISATSSGALTDASSDHANSRSYRYDDTGRLVPVVFIPQDPTEPAALDTVQPMSGWLMYELNAPPPAVTEAPATLARADEEHGWVGWRGILGGG
ncbi:hypothetical protein IQ07DRAFT_350920 [Pyrenochaeta sp. DS3sAY3a]|nr:hypothetical protein IQ07DRAFT_350920 [Pyrenochaeta sp. DS3sAY3a]